MTPADIIKPFLLDADRRKPQLRIDNRFQSCGELLDDTLALGGPDWQFIGKSSKKGESGYRPAWFSPRFVSCQRPDGQAEQVLIDLLGMDAAWHMPTRSQVKVIVNSTANELPIDDPRRGPANLTPYMIPEFNPDTNERQWRWHNPPMPQRAGGSLPVPMPVPSPTPAPAPTSQFPYPDEATLVKALQDRVKAAYKAVGRSFPDPNDSDAYRHFARFGYDCRGMDAQAAADKRIKELRQELGAPVEPR